MATRLANFPKGYKAERKVPTLLGSFAKTVFPPTDDMTSHMPGSAAITDHRRKKLIGQDSQSEATEYIDHSIV